MRHGKSSSTSCARCSRECALYEREVLPNSCFSIEPGIYLPEFGLRSEVNMLVHSGSAEVTDRVQQEMILI